MFGEKIDNNITMIQRLVALMRDLVITIIAGLTTCATLPLRPRSNRVNKEIQIQVKDSVHGMGIIGKDLPKVALAISTVQKGTS